MSGRSGRNSTVTGSLIGTHYDKMSMRGMIIPPKRTAFFYNLRNIFAYKPQSQEYLYTQLFEDSGHSRSMRGSLIFNHMQVVDEVRMNESQNQSSSGAAALQTSLKRSMVQLSPSNRETTVLNVINTDG